MDALEYKDSGVQPATTVAQARKNLADFAHKQAERDPFAYASERERAALAARLAEARRRLRAEGRL